MNEVMIDRFLTRAEVRDAAEESRVRRLADDLARRELERAFDAAVLPAGLWCLRRVAAEVHYDDRPDADLCRSWAESLVVAAVEGLAASRPPGEESAPSTGQLEGVHYAGRWQVLVDLVASVARGRTERTWAWRVAGVLAPEDPDPWGGEPRAAVLAVLGRHAELVVPVMAEATMVAGFPAVDRLLGEAGWRVLAISALRACDQSPDGWLAPSVSRARPGPPLRRTAARVAEVSRIARSWRASRLRPGSESADAVALLAVLEAEPALLRRPAQPALLQALRAAVGADSVAAVAGLALPREHARGVRSPQPVTTAGDDASPAAPPDRDAGTDAAPSEPRVPTGDEPPGEATSLGGLVYLLATAQDAGIPDRLLADPALQDSLPTELLHELLATLAAGAAGTPRVHDADPALAALSGRDPRAGRPAPLTDGARAAVERHATRWRHATARRLRADDAVAAVAGVLARAGRVVTEPGWVEFRLRLEDVDVEVRRAGLDLDPGFVPWLGAVVVIRYG